MESAAWQKKMRCKNYKLESDNLWNQTTGGNVELSLEQKDGSHRAKGPVRHKVAAEQNQRHSKRPKDPMLLCKHLFVQTTRKVNVIAAFVQTNLKPIHDSCTLTQQERVHLNALYATLSIPQHQPSPLLA